MKRRSTLAPEQETPRVECWGAFCGACSLLAQFFTSLMSSSAERPSDLYFILIAVNSILFVLSIACFVVFWRRDMVWALSMFLLGLVGTSVYQYEMHTMPEMVENFATAEYPIRLSQLILPLGLIPISVLCFHDDRVPNLLAYFFAINATCWFTLSAVNGNVSAQVFWAFMTDLSALIANGALCTWMIYLGSSVLKAPAKGESGGNTPVPAS
ncbi:hypothetical protein [Corynebacterium epidermidicanis]|uniref:Uncharacterized protein n=1 Tax=Corynebacterium epidermidicanis TaxID=1050174 RepID=A0A0G3GPD0_9CORY|nr:hypothetical protein [Corynebacterium epidermidicanis]AKK02430.1 hypothetical protein CEPID_02750 [Corynebacterium epidermidicanis]